MGSTILCLKGLVIAAVLVISVSLVFAWENRWEIKERDPYGSGRYSGSTDIEMRKKYDYNPSSKFRGTIEDDGSVRMRDYNGNALRGSIDNDGYGKLRDQEGNTYRVRPR